MKDCDIIAGAGVFHNNIFVSSGYIAYGQVGRVKRDMILHYWQKIKKNEICVQKHLAAGEKDQRNREWQ